MSFELFPAQYKTVSSAYNIMLGAVSGMWMSLIINPKRRGLRMDPCGTPQVTLSPQEPVSKITFCFLLKR